MVSARFDANDLDRRWYEWCAVLAGHFLLIGNQTVELCKPHAGRHRGAGLTDLMSKIAIFHELRGNRLDTDRTSFGHFRHANRNPFLDMLEAKHLVRD